jgi:hypothetical protein
MELENVTQRNKIQWETPELAPSLNIVNYHLLNSEHTERLCIKSGNLETLMTDPTPQDVAKRVGWFGIMVIPTGLNHWNYLTSHFFLSKSDRPHELSAMVPGEIDGLGAGQTGYDPR